MIAKDGKESIERKLRHLKIKLNSKIETEMICTRIIGTRIIANILPKRLFGVTSRNLII